MAITAPGAGVPVTNGNSYTITWTAADPDSPAFITLYHAPDASGTGGTQIATGIAKEMSSYTWDTSALPDGIYYVYGVIADGRSQVTAVAAGPITIDRTPPGVPQVSGAALTNNPIPTWSWAGGGGGNGNYRYTLDSGDFSGGGSPTNATTFTPAAALTGGTHTLYVQERDDAGNWSASGSFQTIIDLILPTAVISGAPTQPTRDTDVTLTISGDDVVSYRYTLDSQDFPAETPVATPIQQVSLADGIHTVTVFGRDSAGNWQTTGTEVRWEVDTVPPAAIIGGIPPNPTNAAGATLTIGGEQVTAYRYKVDEGVYSGETVVSTPVTLTSLAEGIHTVSVIGRDSAGNWQAEGSASTAAWMVDLTAPVLDVSTLRDGTNTNVAELNISGTVTDANGIVSLAIKYTGGGTSSSGEIPIDGKGAFSQVVTLSMGANTLELIARDRAGNQTRNTRTINYDSIGPNLTITSPADNLKTNQPFVQIGGDITGETAATIQVTVYDRNQAPVDSQSASITGAKFTATANLAEGLNTVIITGRDQTGNESSFKRTVTYDNQKPTLAITEPAQDLRTNLHIMAIKGTVADALSDVAVTVQQDDRDAEPVSLVAGEAVQTFEKQVTFTDSRVYHILVTAKDAAGNESSIQRNIIFAAPAWGDINQDKTVDVLDALIALQIASGLITQTDQHLIYGDVAPLVNGKPVSDGRINIGDAVVILQAAVKLITLEAPAK
nr:Ser-Thr-rich GPI-anchored membrane family protein [Geotalea sp. SG265]